MKTYSIKKHILLEYRYLTSNRNIFKRSSFLRIFLETLCHFSELFIIQFYKKQYKEMKRALFAKHETNTEIIEDII